MMSKRINLNQDTIDLITKLNLTKIEGFQPSDSSIPRNNLIDLFKRLADDEQNKEQHFLIESLRAMLWSDLRESFVTQELPQKPGLFARIKFWSFVIAGTVLAAYEGFDGIAALLSLVSLPAWAGYLLFGIFVASSVACFYAFDLAQISENMGVSFAESRKLLDVLLTEAQVISFMREYIQEKSNSVTVTVAELNEFSMLMQFMIEQQARLTKKQAIYNDRLNRPSLTIAKQVSAILSGALFFSGGFFLSQAPAEFVFALLGFSASSMAVPVIVFALAGGLAAFALYWYIQRPGLDKFMSRQFGLDKDKIDGLDKTEYNNVTKKDEKTTDKLRKLKQYIDDSVQDKIARTTPLRETHQPAAPQLSSSSPVPPGRFFSQSPPQADLKKPKAAAALYL
jgi:hypothetical protein